MKVRDLLEEIESCKKKHPDFLEWDVYTQQIGEEDKKEVRNDRLLLAVPS